MSSLVSFLSVVVLAGSCSILVTGCSGDKDGTKSSSVKSKSGDRSLTISARSSGSSTDSMSGSSDSSAGSAATTGGGSSRRIGTMDPTKPSGPNPLLTSDPTKYKMQPRTAEERKAVEILKSLEPLVAEGKAKEALEGAEKAAKIAPDFPPVWNAVGLLSAGIDKGSSFAALKRAVELDPYYYTAWGNLGVLYERENRFAEALGIFKHMTQLVPNNSKVWVSYGEMCLECNRPEEAESAFKRAIEVDPKSCGGWYMLGYLYHGTKLEDGTIPKIAEAEKCYRKAIELEPRIVQAYLHLGVLYRSQKRLKDAEHVFRKLTKISPDYSPGWTNLASVVNERGDLKEAQKILAQGRKFNPLTKGEVLLEKSVQCLRNHDFVGARKWAMEARRSNVNWYRGWYMLGRIALEENKLDEAIQYFQGAIKCDKTYADSYNLMGCALAYQSKMMDARKVFEKCVALEPNNATFLSNLSESMRETDGDKRKARLLAKRAEKLEPNNPHVVSNAAKFLLVDGFTDQAIQKLQYAIKLDPTYGSSWNYLGVAYANKKDGNRAIACFQKAVQVDKDNTEAWKNLAELYRIAGDKKAEAEALKNSVKSRGANTAEGLYSVAYKLEKLGQKSSASEALKQGLDMDPAEADVLLNVPYVEDQHKDEAIFSAPPDLLKKRGRSD